MHSYHYRAASHAGDCQAVVPAIHPLEFSVHRIKQAYPKDALCEKLDRHCHAWLAMRPERRII